MSPVPAAARHSSVVQRRCRTTPDFPEATDIGKSRHTNRTAPFVWWKPKKARSAIVGARGSSHPPRQRALT